MESPFLELYKYYQTATATWNGEETSLLGPYALESEIKDNFLSANDIQKSNYVKLLNHRIFVLKQEVEYVTPLLQTLKDDIKNSVVNRDEIVDFYRSTISTFVYCVEDTMRMAKGVLWTIERNISVFYPQPAEPQPTEPGNGVNPLPLPAQTIHWNTDASALYDIFGQLLKMTMPNGVTPINRKEGDHTIKDLAAMIHHHFSFAKGNPTLDQVERQLQLMTDPANAGAKRNKITIEINCKPDTE